MSCTLCKSGREIKGEESLSFQYSKQLKFKFWGKRPQDDQSTRNWQRNYKLTTPTARVFSTPM